MRLLARQQTKTAAAGGAPSLAKAGFDFLQHPLIAGSMLTAFVALAIALVGNDFARRKVITDTGDTQARDLSVLNKSLHASNLGLSQPSAREGLRVLAATTDFEAAVRRAMFGVTSNRLDIYSVDGDRVFSSSRAEQPPLVDGLRDAFIEARARGRATMLEKATPDAASAGTQDHLLTTFALITSVAPGSDSAGAPVMVAALTTDISDDVAGLQQTVWLTAGTFGGGLLVVLVVVHWVSERSRKRLQTANEALLAQNAAVRESRERMLKTADDTKRAIAEELHGAVQTKLFAVWMKLSDVRGRLPAEAARFGGELDVAIQEVDRIREEDIRALSHRLHPSIVRVGAAAGLRSLCNFYDSMVPLELTIGDALQEIEPAGMSKIPESVRLAVYRIAELALGNVARHAKAGNCTVSFDYDWTASELRLEISDDGKGFDMAEVRPTGLGVVTMNDYADALGGRLTFESAPDRGTKVAVAIPFEVAGRAAPSGSRDGKPAGRQVRPFAVEQGPHDAPATGD